VLYFIRFIEQDQTKERLPWIKLRKAFLGRNKMSNEKELAELVEKVVDKGATTAEEIHREVVSLPIKVLEGLGLFENTTEDVKKIQDVSIGAVYDLIRNINHKVAGIATELLGKDEEKDDE
jgi:hypothetical protein